MESSVKKVQTTLVCGPPGSGKSTFVRENKGDDDLVLDVDELFKAFTLRADREKPECLLPFVLEARDAVLRHIVRGMLGPPRVWVIMCGENNLKRAELAKTLDADVVVLPVPAGECQLRMQAQGRPSKHVSEMLEVAVRWHQLFRRQEGEEVLAGSMTQYGVDGWPQR